MDSMISVSVEMLVVRITNSKQDRKSNRMSRARLQGSEKVAPPRAPTYCQQYPRSTTDTNWFAIWVTNMTKANPYPILVQRYAEEYRGIQRDTSFNHMSSWFTRTWAHTSSDLMAVQKDCQLTSCHTSHALPICPLYSSALATFLRANDWPTLSLVVFITARCCTQERHSTNVSWWVINKDSAITRQLYTYM